MTQLTETCDAALRKLEMGTPRSAELGSYVTDHAEASSGSNRRGWSGRGLLFGRMTGV